VGQYYTLPSVKDILITSCMKRVDNAAFNVVQRTMEGSFPGGGIYVGTLESSGVGLAPLHEFRDEIPAELKQEVRAVIAGIIDGEIGTGWPPTMACE
jgi:basic membrane protein A